MIFEDFFKCAKEECADYSPKGNKGLSDYCFGSGKVCKLKENNFCQYFNDRVIVLKKYEHIFEYWKEVDDNKGRCKMCRAEFDKTSNNQSYCVECGKINEKKQNTIRKRKNRKSTE